MTFRAYLAKLFTAVISRLPGRRTHQQWHSANPASSARHEGSVDQHQAIMHAAGQAAARTVMGAPAVNNPYPPGTRFYVLWETHYHRVLMDLTHDVPAQPAGREGGVA